MQNINDRPPPASSQTRKKMKNKKLGLKNPQAKHIKPLESRPNGHMDRKKPQGKVWWLE